MSKWSDTMKFSRADSFCKNFENFVCFDLKSRGFREVMRYDIRFSFFGSYRFLVATVPFCFTNSVKSSYKTSLYEVQNNRFHFSKNSSAGIVKARSSFVPRHSCSYSLMDSSFWVSRRDSSSKIMFSSVSILRWILVPYSPGGIIKAKSSCVSKPFDSEWCFCVIRTVILIIFVILFLRKSKIPPILLCENRWFWMVFWI